MEFIRKQTLLNELVLVDGIGRSGKVMLAEIITGFERVEKQDYHEFLEYIPLAYKYNKISKDIAISILKTQFDTELYKNMIGRSVNTRPTDYTSLYKYHTPSKYLERLVSLDGPIVAKRVKEEKPIYLNWCHDLIQKSDIIFEAYQSKVKLVYINRRPIDIIYEWDLKNFGERVANDPTEMQYLIKYNEHVVPEIAFGWEEEYINMTPLERIVKMIHTSFKRNLEAIKKTQYLENIKVINFEDLVTEPYEEIDKLSSFLNTKKLEVMDNILFKERCPRKLSQEEFSNRKRNIYENVNNVSRNYIDEMEIIYNNISEYSNK